MDFLPKIRKIFHISPDPFDDYSLKETPEDLKKLADMQETIKNSAKFCFKRCVKLDDNDFSSKEEKCIQNCVINQIQGLEHLIREYDVKKEISDIHS